jgi:hypothetical protein
MKTSSVKPFSLKSIYALVPLILLFSVVSASSSENKNNSIKDWQYKGVVISAYWFTAFQSPYLERQIDYYTELGVNAVEFIPIEYQDSFSSTEIREDKKRTIPADELKKAIIYAKNKNPSLRVNLKPHVEVYYAQKLTEEEFMGFYNRASTNDKILLEQCYPDDHYKYRNLSPHIRELQKDNCRTIMEKIDGSFFWRARIKPKDEDVKSWFESYEKFLKKYLDIAVDTKVDIFTVGTELVAMTQPEYLNRWEQLMSHLRAYIKYKANIQFTYAAHESELLGTPNAQHREWWIAHRNYPSKPDNYPPLVFGERWDNTDKPFKRDSIIELSDEGECFDKPNLQIKENLQKFWNLFDIVSITVYFELGNHLAFMVDDREKTPAEDEQDGNLKKFSEKWTKKIGCLTKWRTALAMNKPMLFAELGYRSVNYSHYKPYKSHGKIFTDRNDLDQTEVFSAANQANAYNAAFQTLANVSWLQGVFLWQQEIKDPPVYAKADNTSYSLIGKSAAAVVHNAFTGKDLKQQPPAPSCLSMGLEDLEAYDRYDLDAGGGLAKSTRNKKSWYTWTKLHVRPISQCLSSDTLTIQYGLWISGATGGGKIPVFDSEYDWDRLLGGVAMKMVGKVITWDIDLGVGKVYEDDSARNDKYQSKQQDKIYYLSGLSLGHHI